jgi:hypothetical protein
MNDQLNSYTIQHPNGPTIAAGPTSRAVRALYFDETDQLLGLGATELPHHNMTIFDPVLDTDTLTIVLAGQADASGTGTDRFIDFDFDTTGAFRPGLVGIGYDHEAGQLFGYAGEGVIAHSWTAGEWFVSELVWDSLKGFSFSVFSDDSSLSHTGTSNGYSGMDFDRFRLGRFASLAPNGDPGDLLGHIGDVYLFDSASEDNTDLIDQLVHDYYYGETEQVPEPSTFIVWSLLGGLGMTFGWWRRRRQHTSGRFGVGQR